MSRRGPISERQDATRNRDRLIAAAREVFSARGAEVPLEEVARAAGVSRATLYRNFATREDLAATVFADNVDRIESRAARSGGDPTAIIGLYHYVLDMQLANPALARALSRADPAHYSTLSKRVAAAFAPLLARGHDGRVVHAGVSIADLMRTLPMAAAAIEEDDYAGRPRGTGPVRTMLHRALFTTDPGDAVRASAG